MAEYKFEAARAAGVSDEDIVDELRKRGTYDYKFDDARAAGVGSSEIVDFLMKTPERYKGEAPQQPTIGMLTEGSTALPQYTQPEDVSASQPSPTQFNPEAIKDENTAGMGVLAGAVRLPLGVSKITQAALNQLSEEEYSFADKWIKANEAYIKENNLEGPALVGEILTNMSGGGLVAKAGVKSSTGISLSESLLEATAGLGTERTPTEIAINAVAAGVISKGILSIVNKFGTKALPKVYDHMLDHYNVSPAKAEADFVNWQKIKDAPDTAENRIKSLVDNLGERGAEIKFRASADSEAVKNMNKSTQETKEALIKAAEGDFNVETFADDLKKNFDRVGDEYEQTKQLVGDSPVEMKFETEPWAALDEATAGNVAELKLLIGEDNAYIRARDLIEASPIVNDLIRKTQGRTRGKWKQVKKAMETQLEDVLEPADYNLWTKANENFAKMAEVRSSKLGDLIQTAAGTSWKGSAKQTPEAIMRQIKTVSGGDDIFSNIVELVGPKQAASLEKAMIKRTLEGSLGDASWETISKNLESSGFVTPAGKNLKELITTVRDTFRTDDAVRALNTQAGFEGASIATTIMGKLQVSMVQKVVTMMRKHIPFNKTAEHLLNMDEVYKILESPTATRDLVKRMSEMGEGVKANIGKTMEVDGISQWQKTMKSMGMSDEEIESMNRAAGGGTPPKDFRQSLDSEMSQPNKYQQSSPGVSVPKQTGDRVNISPEAKELGK